MIYLYYLLFIILTPLYPFVFLIRALKDKEDLARWKERWGIASGPRQKGCLIWLHGASLGESIAALTLIENINKIRSDLNFLLTTSTLSAAKNIVNKLPSNAIHQFQPIDNILAVKNFLRHWRPNLGIFFESELWPALLFESSKNCRLLLLNACISDKSFNFWRSFLQNSCPAKYFTEIATQSIKDSEKFQQLTTNKTNKVTMLGNIKFANKKLFFDENIYFNLKKHFADKKIIVFASTHTADERVLFDILSDIKNSYPNCYFILAPRHPHRAAEIVRNCQRLSLTHALSSAGKLPSLDKDLYIIDEFGLLGLYYNLSYISFIGGSFDIGGHNILEPAYFDNLIIFGPDISSCFQIGNEMLQKGAAIQVSNAEELALKIKYFLSTKGADEIKIISSNAYKFVKQGSQVITDYLKIVTNYID